MRTDDVTTTEVMRVEAPSNQDMSVVLVEAEARAKLMKMILPQLVRVCYASNIMSMKSKDKNGSDSTKPYINSDGCQKIARIVGISFGKPEITISYEDMPPEKEELYEDSGRVKKPGKPARRAYIVEVQGEASLMGQTITEFGGASSEDGFYNRPNESSVEIRLDVRKKAMANWQGRCVRTLLGLQGLSWEDLEATGEFNRETAIGVDYKTGKYSSRKDTSDDKAALDEVRTNIRNQILNDVQGNNRAAKELLEILTAFEGKDGKQVPGVQDVARLSDGRATTTWNRIKPGGKDRDKYYDILRDILEKHDINPDQPPEGEGVTA